MNHVYAHARPGEPTARLNHHLVSPFAVVDFGDWYFTSEDPAWCRRVAAARTHAAELLESATTTAEARTRSASTAQEEAPPSWPAGHPPNPRTPRPTRTRS